MSLQVTDLRVYYRTLAGDVKALDGVTFSIADGEIMGLAGESGCGKSTLGNSLIHLDSRMRYVGGRGASSTACELPIMDSEAMDDFRFRSVSIIPQYAMSAMNPTRKIGTMIGRPARVAGRGRRPRCAPSSNAAWSWSAWRQDVLDRYPIELSGGMKQRMVMVISTLLNPSLLIADEITSALDVSTPEGRGRDARRVPRPGVRPEHDRHHPRHVDPVPDRRHDHRDVRREAGREGRDRRHHRRAPASLHAAADLVAARGRRQVRGQAAVGHPRQPAVAARTRPRAAASGLDARSRSSSAARSRRSSRSNAGHFVACWKVS